jgi:CRP-like cAMP-binding protein
MGGADTTKPLRAAARTFPALLDDDDPALFPKLTDEQLSLLAKYGQVRSIEVGELLFREGDATYDVMVLMEGCVSVMMGSGADERELAIQRPRDLMVELNLLTGQRVHATGVVREAGSALVIPAEEFRALLGRELVFGDFVLQTLFRRRQALERLQLGIQIVGSRFDRDTHRLREFAARNRVLHDWLDTDDPRAEALIGARIDAISGPIVLLGGGTLLRNPTNAELTSAIGLHQGSARAEKIYDLVVVGAGPAGLACSPAASFSPWVCSTADCQSHVLRIMKDSVSPTQPTRRESSCVPATPLSWWGVRTQPDRRLSLSAMREGACTSWSARMASSALWHDTCATALSATPMLRFYSVMRSENSMVMVTWSELRSRTSAPKSAGL